MGIATRSSRQPHTDTLLRSSVTQPSKINLKTANCNKKTVPKITDQNIQLKKKVTDEIIQLDKKITNENIHQKKIITNKNTQQKKKVTVKNTELKKKVTDENIQLKKKVTDENIQLKKKITDDNIQLKKKITDENIQLKKKTTNENTQLKKKTTDENTQLDKKITNENIQGKKKITDESTQPKKSVPLKRIINPKCFPDEGNVCKKYLKSLQKSSDVDLTKKAPKRAILKEKTNVIVSAEITPLLGGVIPLPKNTNLRSQNKKNIHFDLQKEQKENVHIPVYKKSISLQKACLYSSDVYDITKDEDFLLNEPQQKKVAANQVKNKRNVIKKSRVNQYLIKDSVENTNLKSKERKVKNSSNMIVTKNASKGISVTISKNKPVSETNDVDKSVPNSSASEIQNSITVIMDEIFSSYPVESVHAEKSTEIINHTSPKINEKTKTSNSMYHSTLSNTLRNSNRTDDSETKYYSCMDGKLDLAPPCTPEKEKQDTEKLLLDCCDVFEEMFPPPAMTSTPENDDKPIKEMAVLPGNSFNLRFSAIPHAASQTQTILDVPEFEPTLKDKEETTITLFDSPGKNEDTYIQNKSCGSEKEVKRKRQGKEDNCSVKRIRKEASLKTQEESLFEKIQTQNRKSYSSPSLASWKRKCLNTSQKTFQSKTDKLIAGMNKHFLEFDSMELSIE